MVITDLEAALDQIAWKSGHAPDLSSPALPWCAPCIAGKALGWERDEMGHYSNPSAGVSPRATSPASLAIHGYTASGEHVTVQISVAKLRAALGERS